MGWHSALWSGGCAQAGLVLHSELAWLHVRLPSEGHGLRPVEGPAGHQVWAWQTCQLGLGPWLLLGPVVWAIKAWAADGYGPEHRACVGVHREALRKPRAMTSSKARVLGDKPVRLRP